MTVIPLASPGARQAVAAPVRKPSPARAPVAPKPTASKPVKSNSTAGKPLPAEWQPWILPQKAVYLMEAPGLNWKEAPAEKKQWLELLSQIMAPPLTGEEKRRLQDQVRHEWEKILKPEWLPPLEMITIRPQSGTPAASSPVGSAAFVRGGANAFFLGEAGKSHWLYFEQPTPLPAGGKPIATADILKPELSAPTGAGNDEAPQSAFTARAFEVYRAFVPGGPFKPVHVVLIQLRLPDVSVDGLGFHP